MHAKRFTLIFTLWILLSGCSFHSQTDIIILMDVNKNQTMSGFLSRKSLIRRILEYLLGLHFYIQIGLVTFSDHPDFVYKLGWSSNLDKLIAASQMIDLDTVSASSNTAHALEFLKDDGFSPLNNGRDSARKIVMLLSDANWDSLDLIKEKVFNLQTKGIITVGVAHGTDVFLDRFTLIQSDPSNLIYIPIQFKANSYDGLKALSSMTAFYSCKNDIFN